MQSTSRSGNKET
uniref:Uncharacterized protein n=1 Tax=Romanomermis culicivorax TaxID=13658 RepID=A0A915KXE9_ROMCU